MFIPQFEFKFYIFLFSFIFDSHYKVAITGASLLSTTFSDVTFVFCTLTGMLTNIAKARKRTWFYAIDPNVSFGTL